MAPTALDNLTQVAFSVGSARHARSNTSWMLQHLLSTIVLQFTSEMQRRASANPANFFADQRGINVMWSDAVNTFARELQDKNVPEDTVDMLTDNLARSTYPDQVYETALRTYGAASAAGLSEDQTKRLLTEALDFDTPSVDSPNTSNGASAALTGLALLGLVALSDTAPAPRPIDAPGGEVIGVGFRGQSWREQTRVLAETMSTTAYNDAVLQHLADSGHTHKRWVSYHDSKVRDTHVSMDGVTLPLEQPFNVAGSLMRYPADPQASDIQQVYGCRCIIVGAKADASPEHLSPLYR